MQSEAKRGAGIMLPLSALPSRHGVGDMGEAAYQFIDRLAARRVRYWQILPFNPLGYGNSPYQPYSSFAGDPLFLSLDTMHARGLLPHSPAPFREHTQRVSYDAVRSYKEILYRQAFKAFHPDPAYDAFIAQPWVHPYAVFMAFKRANGMRGWRDWPQDQQDWPQNRAVDLTPFADDIRLEMFLQYQFAAQWASLKRYANERGISIIGDIPIYVGIDSLDVWAGRENFLLDAQGDPTFIAGVPPDYFSKTGQRWGNPLYDWQHMQDTGFAFWIDRLRQSGALFDIVRIDHFRGFDTYWAIPADCPTAVEGAWREAPGYALFDTVKAALPGLRIIAEDLGMLRDEVYALRDHYHFRGMKILQFTYDPNVEQQPSADRAHMVVYTGTHDNETTKGWYRAHPPAWRRKARRSLRQAGYRHLRITDRFIHLALDNAADMAILPAQDILNLDDQARLNTPGTLGSPNWEWKLRDYAALDKALPRLGKLIAQSGRDN